MALLVTKKVILISLLLGVVFTGITIIVPFQEYGDAYTTGRIPYSYIIRQTKAPGEGSSLACGSSILNYENNSTAFGLPISYYQSYRQVNGSMCGYSETDFVSILGIVLDLLAFSAISFVIVVLVKYFHRMLNSGTPKPKVKA